LCLTGLVAHDSHKQISNAGLAHLSEGGKLLAISAIEQ
jgi:hypothetical protein